jgi:hypothetical protein
MTPSIVWDRRHAALCTGIAGTGKAQSYYIRSNSVFAVQALVHDDLIPQGSSQIRMHFAEFISRA